MNSKGWADAVSEKSEVSIGNWARGYSYCILAKDLMCSA